MPVYEYACCQCGERFEELVLGSEIPRCPRCASRELEKQLSAFAVGAEGLSGSPPAPGACGTCGDPRGPGACSLD